MRYEEEYHYVGWEERVNGYLHSFTWKKIMHTATFLGPILLVVGTRPLVYTNLIHGLSPCYDSDF